MNSGNKCLYIHELSIRNRRGHEAESTTMPGVQPVTSPAGHIFCSICWPQLELVCLLHPGALNTLPTVCMNKNPNWRILNLALTIIFFDQLTKFVVLRYLGFAEEKEVIRGFFKFVHWGNTGAAWSMFTGNNGTLAIVAIVAVIVLFFTRHHFNIHTIGGQVSLGLIFGGIIGNLIDRLMPSREHVVDFIYFYVIRRDGQIAGFPAFNIADSAICIGVGLLFLLSWRNESAQAPAGEMKS